MVKTEEGHIVQRLVKIDRPSTDLGYPLGGKRG